MGSAPDLPATRSARGPLVVMLTAAVLVMYIDRGLLSTAAPLLKSSMGFGAAQIGLLSSAFYWSYTPGQLAAGWASERLGPVLTLALGAVLWSLAAAATGLAGSLAVFLALRLLMGLGETAVFPCTAKLLAGSTSPARLGMANGWVVSGTALGPSLGAFVGGLVMASMGWRAAFVIVGLASLAWAPAWLAFARERPPGPGDAPAPAPVSLAQVLRRREAWGAGLGHFANNHTHYFLTTWVALFLVRERGFSMAGMAGVAGAIYFVQAASVLAAGWLSDRLIAGGAPLGRVRRGVTLASHLGVAVSLAGCALAPGSASVALLFVAAAFQGLNGSAIYAIGQTLAGPRAAGAWMGLQNGLGNLAGIVGPLIAGIVIERFGFAPAFALAAGVALTGLLGWLVLIPRLRPLDWASDPSATFPQRSAAVYDGSQTQP